MLCGTRAMRLALTVTDDYELPRDQLIRPIKPIAPKIYLDLLTLDYCQVYRTTSVRRWCDLDIEISSNEYNII